MSAEGAKNLYIKMDRSEIYVNIIYISIIVSGWMINEKAMQGVENIYYKKFRSEHHHKNFEESILGDITPYGLRIYKNRESVEFHLILWSNGIQF